MERYLIYLLEDLLTYYYLMIFIGFVALVKCIVMRVVLRGQERVILNTVLITYITLLPLFIIAFPMRYHGLSLCMVLILVLLLMIIEVLMYRYCYRNANFKRFLITYLLLTIILILFNWGLYHAIADRPRSNSSVITEI